MIKDINNEKLKNAHSFIMNGLNIPKHSKEDIEMRLKVNRTHEECADCLFEWTNPPVCKGHSSGPVSCSQFVDKRKNPNYPLDEECVKKFINYVKKTINKKR